MALNNKGEFAICATSGGTYVEYSAKSISLEFESLADENSGRTDDGVMHVSFIQPKLRKWVIEMPPCDASTISAIMNIVQGKTYYIKIFDISTNKWTDGTSGQSPIVHVYTSSSKADCYSGVLTINNGQGIYTGFSFNAIELGSPIL